MKIVCSHGFGVDKTGRGMFTDIASAFPQLQFDMFDYNERDGQGNTTVRSLNYQAAILNNHLQGTIEKVTLLCHSQGCVIASLADLSNVDTVIFLAPPDNLDIERFSKVFGNRPGAEFNPDGTSVIPRRDGTKTYLGKDYIDSIQAVDVIDLYKKVGEQYDLTIVRAAHDEIVSDTKFPEVRAHIITIPGGHDFSKSRASLKEALRPLLG